MSPERLDELIELLKKAARLMPMLDISKFQARGHETCFHGRHLGPQIYAGLDGTNWRLDGLRGARRLCGAAQDPGRRRRCRPDARAGDRRGQASACAGAAARASRRV
jgi:hypothetical protein